MTIQAKAAYTGHCAATGTVNGAAGAAETPVKEDTCAGLGIINIAGVAMAKTRAVSQIV
jgi:hypothetical protein